MAFEILQAVYFGNSLYNYLLFLGIIAASIILGKLVYYISKNIIKKLAAKTATTLDDAIINILEEPLLLLIIVLGINYAYHTLTLPPLAFGFFQGTVKVLVIVAVAWFIIRFLDEIMLNFLKQLTIKTGVELDDHIIPLVRKLTKIILVAITSVMILDTWGYKVTSILAGLGLGGLAFALAAKDMLANFFGGLSIIMDKPFKVGESIVIEGKRGTVEEIGLRSTKIRTVDKTQLIVPNSFMADKIVENITREEARKITLHLGLVYSTSPEKIELAIKIITDIVKKNKSTLDLSHVYFDSYGDSSLIIQAIYYIKETDSEKISQAKNEINLEILKQFNINKLKFAFPTRTIYLEK